MEPDRLNAPDTWAYTFEVMGHELQFCQDPNSKHLGTTVWDASLVFVKFLEKNSRKGRFCPSKLKGKRVIELGAGCGVAGFGMALLGCDVLSTDQAEVLPLLLRNAERNTSSITQTNPCSDSFGCIRVAELSWGSEDHIRAVGPPFDYIIGTDVVYSEHLLEPLLKTLLALSGPKTTIMLAYEIRSTNVHEQMLDLWKRNFEMKTVSKSKMDSTYQHPSIQMYIMNLKPSETSTESMIQGIDQRMIQGIDQQIGKTITTDTWHDKDEEDSDAIDQVDDVGGNRVEVNCLVGASSLDVKHSDWEVRRHGAMAARLLRDVKIT